MLKNIDPIEYGDNYFKILYALQKLLQRDVDLVAEETLTNPYFIKVMNKTKTTIYEWWRKKISNGHTVVWKIIIKDLTVLKSEVNKLINE